MKRVAIILGSFCGGFVLGAYLMHEKYQERLDADSASLDEYYRNKYTKNGSEETVEEIDTESIEKCEEISKDSGYVNYSDVEKEPWLQDSPIDPIDEVMNTPEPDEYDIEIIDPDLYGEDPDYAQKTLTYYADGYLVDEWDTVIHDVEGTVGPGALETFGDFEDDAVHVKNNAESTYYEILKSEEKFSNVVWDTVISPRS